MADKFPSNIGSTPFSLADTFDRARSLAGQIKYATQDLSKASAAGPVSAVTIKQFAGGLAQQRQQMAALAATTGLPAYVQQQYPTLDLVAVALDALGPHAGDGQELDLVARPLLGDLLQGGIVEHHVGRHLVLPGSLEAPCPQCIEQRRVRS